jgi:IS30 family transposase
MDNIPPKPKEQEIYLRRQEVERLHIWGYSVQEIAEQMNVDMRTISRDIQANRRERLNMLVYSNAEGSRNQSAKEWLRNELADYVAFMEGARRTLLEQSRTFKTEAGRTRAIVSAVQVTNQKIETIKSLMFSIDDIASGGMSLDDGSDNF